ncbi:hypothetical protein [Methylobacterium persicinum]|uniref:Uncharacterized protein n=1 Tax=Methylobacterium persicinum TaxID=374426 RepID=A0ABU0HSS5_9HYPH|nr:hypothetical protein [Methylobacterium persicinum]MDQ0445383.1 hypothetical protein [Methylobacterium persicinum]GJE40549.1 hypothetical protein KHHGKMAE_4644 [Methylobacterium persicinum]
MTRIAGRVPGRAFAAFVLGVVIGPGNGAVAQEVLFLHIRPQADLSAAGTAGAALAAREAVWERSNARARAIIETVCTGCLGPWSPPPGKLVTTAAVSEIPVARGVEPDPSLKASDATSDPSIPERRP